MPGVRATLEYLQNLPLYQTEKPYWCLLPPREGFDPDKHRVDNLEFEVHHDIPISDIREDKDNYVLDKCGFQVLSHQSKFSAIETARDVQTYKDETEELLKKELGAVFVRCYELRRRVNKPIQRQQFDINDPLLIEGPARGVHSG
jgi:hypothetical protein